MLKVIHNSVGEWKKESQYDYHIQDHDSQGQVEPSLCFSMTTPKSGNASTRHNTGYLNFARAPGSSLEHTKIPLQTDLIEQAIMVNSFRNSLNNYW
jgi:hypothetical protein